MHSVRASATTIDVDESVMGRPLLAGGVRLHSNERVGDSIAWLSRAAQTSPATPNIGLVATLAPGVALLVRARDRAGMGSRCLSSWAHSGTLASMRRAVDPIAYLSALISEARSRAEYEAVRLEWLQQHVGFEASYFGAASPQQVVPPVVSGVTAENVERCEAQADRYWQDRLVLHRAAVSSGGAVADHDALSARQRDRMPFYREVVAGHGICATAVGLLRLRGRVSGCVFLGRTGRGARFGREVALLRQALPVLSLGDAVYASRELSQVQPMTPATDSSLTRREQEVVELLCRGFTNAQIAAQLGSSPSTVKNQVSSILSKSSAVNRTELTAQLARRDRLA